MSKKKTVEDVINSDKKITHIVGYDTIYRVKTIAKNDAWLFTRDENWMLSIPAFVRKNFHGNVFYQSYTVRGHGWRKLKYALEELLLGVPEDGMDVDQMIVDDLTSNLSN